MPFICTKKNLLGKRTVCSNNNITLGIKTERSSANSSSLPNFEIVCISIVNINITICQKRRRTYFYGRLVTIFNIYSIPPTTGKCSKIVLLFPLIYIFHPFISPISLVIPFSFTKIRFSSPLILQEEGKSSSLHLCRASLLKIKCDRKKINAFFMIISTFSVDF